jgi:hypothetical protein
LLRHATVEELAVMSLTMKSPIAFAWLIASMLAVMAAPGLAAGGAKESGISPALCGPGDTREPGIQGEVPAGQTANYNCGVKLVGELPRVGNVQGAGRCAYVRSSGNVFVIDMTDPTKPVEVTSVPVHSGSETLRAVVTDKRAVLVSGSSVYDISDCLHPVLAGEIQWPPLSVPGVPVRLLPHDIRVNHAGTKVYASFGLWEADITNLHDPSTWKVTDHRCELAAQEQGPWADVHRQSLKAGLSLCVDATRPNPAGANYVLGSSPLQASLLWPTLSHSPELNADDTRLYAGDQAGGTSGLWAPVAKVHIIDMTKSPLKIIGEVDGPGHGLDWFRVAGREYVLHSNEGGSAGIANQAAGGDTCKPYPRPFSLGWGFEAFVSDVTRPEQARNVSMLKIAINDAEFCKVRQASGHDPWIAYHLIDNPLNAKFAAVNFGNAGLRIFDIRQPASPREVAYFNHGSPVHAGVGHYDAARGLLYIAGSTGLWVLELEPQVRAHLGL